MTPAEKKRVRQRRKRNAPSSRACTVYGLADGLGEIRYVGQTQSKKLESRLKLHMKDARRGSMSPVHMWLIEAGDPQIVALQTNATWNVSEILEIDRRRRNGEPLLNVLRGGNDTLDDARREGVLPDWYQPKKRRAVAKGDVAEKAERAGIELVQPLP